MIESQIVPAGASLEVDSYNLDSYAVGINDNGEDIYEIGGVQMTAAQAEEHADHFLADNQDDYSDSWDEEADSLPSTIVEGLNAVNDALGGEGAAEFYADELLGIGESRMGEVLQTTGMSHEEIQSHANAVLIDMAAQIGMPHDYLMNELQADIERVRASGSRAAGMAMREVIANGIAGDYHAAMRGWDNLRKAMQRGQR